MSSTFFRANQSVKKASQNLCVERGPGYEIDPGPGLFVFRNLQLIDRWILSHCSETVSSLNENLSKADFHFVTKSIRHFIYTCLCDVYLVSFSQLQWESEYRRFGSEAQTKYLVGRTNEWVANPLGLRQKSALQINTRSA